MQLSIQTGTILADFGSDLGAKMIRDAGFTAVDWNIDMALSSKTLSSASELKELCIFERPLDEVLAYFDDDLSVFRKYGLTITQAHAPFPCYFPGREDVLEYCIEVYKRCIELCDAVGCKNLIVHGISVEKTESEITPEKAIYYKELNYRLYRGLIDTLKKSNVIVCLENLFKRTPAKGFYFGTCADPHEAVEYIDTLNREAGKECFGFCLDTGHIHLLRNRFFLYMPILGKRIHALHIHDNDGNEDEHLMPYVGTINWQEFLHTLKYIGYEGDLSFETFAQTKKGKLPPELVPAFLSAIAQTGKYFRDSLAAKAQTQQEV